MFRIYLPLSNSHSYDKYEDQRNGTCGVACRLQNQMMTSVTLPSTSGPMHGGFTTGVADEPVNSESFFETPRPVKRCLPDSPTFSCKKRRKQATPVRISSADSPPEGKPSVPSPEPDLNCPLYPTATLDTAPEEAIPIVNPSSTEPFNLECKREPDDSPSDNNSTSRTDTPVNSEQQTVKPELPWLSELPNKEWMNSNLLSFPPANPMFMGLPQFSQPDSMPPRQPIRIFNPEAYCKLCNKEFCNKYFLKTHKANKHGIYSDPQTASETNTSTMAPVSISSYVNNMKIPTSLFNVDVKMESTKSYPDLYPNPFTTKLFNKSAAKPAGFDVNLSAENADSACSLSATNGFGLPVENALEETAANVDESSSPIRVIQNETTSFKQEFTTDQENYFTSPSKLSPVQQQQQPPQTQIQTQQQLQQQQQPHQLLQQPPQSQQQLQLQSRELELANRFRRIGVMNPKAFCEICCKEYCNKYFLRTHKMKRHGIYIPDDKEKDIKMESAAMSSYIQTSPLNLIIGDRKTSSPSDISCEICGIKFQNLSLFQLHNVSVHATLPGATSGEQLLAGADDKDKDKSVDTISEDLQKLQTMILQLNDLDVSKANCICTSCNKEFENKYFLHAHMMTEHGLLLEDSGDTQKSNETEANINNNTMCDLCGKDFPSFDEMKKHIYEFHQNVPPQRSPEVKEEFNNGFPSTTAEKRVRTPVGNMPSSMERKPSMSLTPTSSYCEICNKELCNKYFMKTHMQRMHGIEIENGAQIGGVICDICNKELCSKYFLRVHKHNTHGIVEYGSGLLQARKVEEPATAASVITSSDPDAALKPGDLADLSHRYFTHFTEVCTICNRRFRSTKWLKAHLLSDHRQAGAEKWAELEQQLQQTMGQSKMASIPGIKRAETASPTIKVPNTCVEAANPSQSQQQQQQKVGLQNVLSSIFGADDSAAKSYNCSFCPFSTPVLPFLFVHERSHTLPSNSESGDANQIKLMQTFSQPDILQHHILSQNPFLPLPPFFNGSGDMQGGEMNNQEPAEENEEVDDSNGGGVPSAAAIAAAASSALPVEDLKVHQQPPPLQPQQQQQQQQPTSSQQQQQQQHPVNKSSKKSVSSKRSKPIRLEMPAEMDQTLKEVARKSQFPATYALPHAIGNSNPGSSEDFGSSPPYVMQAFVVEETATTNPAAVANTATTAAAANAEKKFMPSIVFLPVMQKLSAPITATFTLTPA